jgi:hypothetical protein
LEKGVTSTIKDSEAGPLRSDITEEADPDVFDFLFLGTRGASSFLT